MAVYGHVTAPLGRNLFHTIDGTNTAPRRRRRPICHTAIRTMIRHGGDGFVEIKSKRAAGTLAFYITCYAAYISYLAARRAGGWLSGERSGSRETNR